MSRQIHTIRHDDHPAGVWVGGEPERGKLNLTTVQDLHGMTPTEDTGLVCSCGQRVTLSVSKGRVIAK